MRPARRLAGSCADGGSAAYVDESYDLRPGGGYVLAAVLCTGDAGPLRDLLRALRLPRQDRLHFRHEDDKRRILLAETIAGLALPMVAAFGLVRPGNATATRLRGRCLRRLYQELEGVDTVVFESRGSRPDRHDSSVLAGIARPAAPPTVSFARARDEPMLWLPDILAGAVLHDVLRGDPRYRKALGPVRVVRL